MLNKLNVENAENVIKDYFEKHHCKNIDYKELATNLNIPFYIVVKTCEKLEEKGEIKAF